jgi:hypothetical protein
MTDYKIGDMVWCKGTISKIYPDAVPYQVNFGRGGYIWMMRSEIHLNAPAPAELDDVAVLRRAAELQDNRDYEAAVANRELANRIEAVRRVPTPLEALKALLKLAVAPETKEDDWLAPISAARRAIAAEEAKGGS